MSADTKILIFKNPEEAVFVSRPNRFLALVRKNRELLPIHIHDPGRLPLLRRGSRVLYLPKTSGKAKGKLIAFHREPYGWIFANSGYHSAIGEKILPLLGFKIIRKEVKINNHRIDFEVERGNERILVEIKGCTWFEGDTALFPDAPTDRGREHVKILSKNTPALILFLVMTDRVNKFSVSDVDLKFKEEIKKAVSKGVKILALKFSFDGTVLFYKGKIKEVLTP